VRNCDLLVVGEINVDLILVGTDVKPEFGQIEKLVDAALLTIGSSSVIIACAAARLGLKTAFVGMVGDDPLGRFMLEAMTLHGIDVSSCIVDDNAQTGVSVILSPVGASDQRAILSAPGCANDLTAEQVDRALLEDTRHLHCGGYFLQRGLHESLADVFAAARTRGVSCSLDPNWDPYDRWDGNIMAVLKECDVFLPNGVEAQRISGASSIEEGLRSVAPDTPTVVVKLGEHGAHLRQGDCRMYGAAPVVEAVDTTGAGDTFDAGFLYGYLHGWEAKDSLRLALAGGSLSTRAVGGTSAQPTLEDAMVLAATIRIDEWE
jgi:sugar/nucleoside kinase (ribokinase family)